MSRFTPIVHRSEDDELSLSDSREQAYGLGRILAISDGVFAFALTLLVVQLVVPTIPSAQSSAQLGSQLIEQVPSYFSYVLSFVVIATSWYGHHDSFKFIRRYDGRLVALNFGCLLVIAALPFPTAILGRYGNVPVAAVIYAVAVSLIGALSAAIWWYATYRRRLVAKDLSSQIVTRRAYRKLSAPLAFMLSIPIALWRPNAAEVVWTVLWIALLLLLRWDRIRVR
jgi:uncharacterized membrane protein